MNTRAIIFTVLLLLNLPGITQADSRDLLADTWVATDGVGRRMPTHDDIGKRPDKQRVVGVFYVTWHLDDYHTRFPAPYSADVSRIIAKDPEARLDGSHPKWDVSYLQGTTEPGMGYHPYHWGEPESGYYLSTDRWIIRRDVSMLSDAGVDVLVLDATNGETYWPQWELLLTEMQHMRNEGTKVPQVCFWAFNGPVMAVVQSIYERIYKPGRFHDLWFSWQGKPLLLYNATPLFDPANYPNPNPNYDPDARANPANPHFGDPDYTVDFYKDYSNAVKSFFTLRMMWWGYYEWEGRRYVGTEGNWCFGYDLTNPLVSGLTPGELAARWNGQFEQMAVTPAQHASTLVGKSWTRRFGEPDLNDQDLPEASYVPWMRRTVRNPERYGIYFQDRWDEALAVDPSFIFINDWNEWTAGKFRP